MGNGFSKSVNPSSETPRKTKKFLSIPCLRKTASLHGGDYDSVTVGMDGKSKGSSKRNVIGNHSRPRTVDVEEAPAIPPLANFEQLLKRLRTTEEQIDIIMDMWKHARAKGPNQPGAAILAHIVISNPSLKFLFYQDRGREIFFEDFDMSIHAHRFTVALDEVITNLKDPGIADIKLRSLGARHVSARSLGFQSEYWKIFAQALITQTLDWGTAASLQSFQTRHVWVKLVGEILRIMKEGYTTELARRGQNEAMKDYKPEVNITDPLMKAI